MLQKWSKCCACGALTDPDERHCPVGCANHGRMESIFPNQEEMIALLEQRKVWTKWPSQLNPYYKKMGLH